jgi:succinate dehydrogenase/fumarate reductase flavoprotein subunit
MSVVMTARLPAERGTGSLNVDVLVIGGGGAGLAAAVSAAELGGRVVLVEKNRYLGGTTGMSVGSISASHTRLQRRAGIEDDLGAHFEDLGAFAGDLVPFDNLELRRLYVENSGPTLEWLIDKGVVFFGPMPEPPNSRPRMHNVLPSSRAYISVMSRAARRLGVQFMLQTSASEMLIEEGVIAGAVCTTEDGSRVTVRASKGVILAGGDFSANRQLKASYISDAVEDVDAINRTSTGDGLMLGISVGAMIRNGHIATGPQLRFIMPPHRPLLQRLPPWRALALVMAAAVRVIPDRLLRPAVMAFATSYLAPTPEIFAKGAILVNNRGERFTDEKKTPWLDVPAQPNGEAFIILGGGLRAQLTKWPDFISTAPGVAYAYIDDYRRSRKDIFHESADIPGLAALIKVAPDALYRSITAARSDTPGPFVALGPVKSWIVTTEGGLAVDRHMRVLNDEGNLIEGLFAAGSNGQGGVLLEGHGNHVGWAFVSGRLAGKAAMTSRPRTERDTA